MAEALVEFEKSIELNPNYIKPLYNKMVIIKDQKKYDQAYEISKKIITLDPYFQRSQLQ